MSSRIGIPQRNVTLLSCSRKASPIWRYCKQCKPSRSSTFVASIIESIVSTSHISIAILLPALGHNVYFTQHWRPLPPSYCRYSHRNPAHPHVRSIQSGIAWHGQNSRMMDILCSVRESIPMLQEPSVLDRKSTRLNSSHSGESRMPSSA